jgi:hypothetical protein
MSDLLGFGNPVLDDEHGYRGGRFVLPIIPLCNENSAIKLRTQAQKARNELARQQGPQPEQKTWWAL